MAKKTLLDITQEILEEMGSDNVSSISDTEESTQVAGFVRQAFESLMSERPWSFQRKITNLVFPSNSSTPTTCTLPDDLQEIIWIKYDNKDVTYKDPTEFYELIKGRDISLANVDTGGYRNDIDPSYWTTYDDTTILFDSYDSTEGATLLESSMVVYAYMELAWTHQGNFIVPLPNKYLKMLEDEARSLCYEFIIKQPSGKVEQRLRNKRAQMQGGHSPTGRGRHKSNRNIDYGRK